MSSISESVCICGKRLHYRWGGKPDFTSICSIASKLTIERLKTHLQALKTDGSVVTWGHTNVSDKLKSVLLVIGNDYALEHHCHMGRKTFWRWLEQF